MKTTPPLLPRVLFSLDVQDLRWRLEQVKTYGEWGGGDSGDILQMVLPWNIYRRLSRAAADQMRESQAADLADRLLRELERPVVEITLARDPTSAMIQSITQWLEESSRSPVEAAIHIDPTIIAGVVVGFNGRLHDYSVSKRLRDQIRPTV